MPLAWKPLIGAALLGAAATLGACTGGGYGRSGVAVGYNSGWGNPYWGWYDNYYYPGTGAYVYDRYRHRRAWNDVQRGYWLQRRNDWRGERRWRNNWRDFRGRPGIRRPR